MSGPRIVFYISGHGFGHAVRDIEVINAIAARRPDANISVRTTVPSWLFERVRLPVDLQAVECDTGIVQLDSLRFDERETALRSKVFYDSLDEKVEREARVLRALQADVVVADVPPLAFAAARRAGIRSIALANFTWDWIYSIYPLFDALAPEVIPAMRAAYASATLALRLPFHGGFDPMAAAVEDIPLVARKSRRDPQETRRLLGADPGRPMVLTSFGAYGAPLPHLAVHDTARFTLVSVEQRPPAGLVYEDLVAAADVVISKPGYGIVSECIANRTALLYTSRGRFVEYDLLVREMPRMLRCREISHDDLFAGHWADAIARLLAQPEPPEHPPIDGADAAAAAILRG